MRSDEQSKGRTKENRTSRVFLESKGLLAPLCNMTMADRKVEKIDIPDFKPVLGVRIVNHGLSWDEMSCRKLLFLTSDK